jgi:flagellar protein FliO/FliZ
MSCLSAEETSSPSSIPIIEEKTFEVPANQMPQNFQKTFIRMIISLVVLIGFLFLTFWALKRIMKGKQLEKNQSSSIKILEKRSLSPKTLLYLVEIEDQKILLSESQNEVRSHKVLPEKTTLG